MFVYHVCISISLLDDTKDYEARLVTSIDDITSQFEEMQRQVLEILCRKFSKFTDIRSFIDRLQSLSAVTGCSLRAFDDDLFAEDTSIEILWEKFHVFWLHIFDCHVLEVFLERSCCEEAVGVYKQFSSRINGLSVINELDLVAYYDICRKMQGFRMPFLKVEFKTEKFFKCSVKAIYEALCTIFKINKHALHLTEIKKGSVYAIFHISERLANFLATNYHITGHTLYQLAKWKIITLKLKMVGRNLELIIPKQINKVVIYYTCIDTKVLNAITIAIHISKIHFL